jgi:hypothetical protein
LLRSAVANPAQAATPPFDGITFAALYGMKRYLTAYTGSLIRIRRDSDDAELDIGYDAATGLLDTAAAAAHIGGGSGFVKTWYDQSGNANDATQATAASQPAYSASLFNSLPGVSANSDFLTQPSMAHFPSKRGAIIAVVSGTTNNVGHVISSQFNGPAVQFQAQMGVGSSVARWYNSTGGHQNGTITVTANAKKIYSANRTADTTLGVYLDGAVDVSLTISDNQPSTSTTRLFSNTSIGYETQMAMFAEFAAAISAANHNTIGNELGTLYGITWNTVS